MWLIIKELFSGLNGKSFLMLISAVHLVHHNDLIAPFLYKVYIDQLVTKLCKLDQWWIKTGSQGFWKPVKISKFE